MSQLKLLREPGYVYDLLYILCCAFNVEEYAKEYPEEYREEGIAYMESLRDTFGPVPRELFVFCHAIETGRALLTTRYFGPYHNQFSDGYDFAFLMDKLSNTGRLIREVVRFYFRELEEDTVKECAKSFHAVAPHIKASSYSDEVKRYLYEFFADPIPYIESLRRELIAKETLLSAYYNEHHRTIFDAYNGTTLEGLREQLASLRDADTLTEDTVYVSYCLLNRYHVSTWFGEGFDTVMLGCDYVWWLSRDKTARKAPDLCALGAVLCEPSRLKILQFLAEQGEIPRKELERSFSFSGSTAYHHLTVMIKAGLVRQRGVGKTIYYRLDREYLGDVIAALQALL